MGDTMTTKLAWSGGTAPYLERPVVDRLRRVALGRYGGAGGKNEDGALVWSGDDWTFAVILDGHRGSTSVDATLDLFTAAEPQLLPLCEAGTPSAIPALQQALIALLTSEAARERMSRVMGETACLVAYQWRQHLLWLSIGDNTLYLLHPELARLGQFTLTARNYFEWIGERSSLTGTPAYFSTGIRQLRQGRNTIVLVTDGIEEMPSRPFEPPSAFAAAFNAGPDPAAAMEAMLAHGVSKGVRDSCTMIGWIADNPEPALMPSDMA
jgi:hypothetical protein